MKLKISLLLAAAISLSTSARADLTAPADTPSASPLYVFPTTWSRPTIQVLKTEETPARRYQKWRETTLVTLAVAPKRDDGRVFYSQPLIIHTFDVALEARSGNANFERKWGQLKSELTVVRNETPTLRFWDSSRRLSWGTSTFGRTAYDGKISFFHYTLVTLTYEMEAVKKDGKTNFKASVVKHNGNGLSSSLCACETFDRETGVVRDENGQIVRDTLKRYREQSE